MEKKDKKADANAPAKALTSNKTYYTKNKKGEWVEKTVNKKRGK